MDQTPGGAAGAGADMAGAGREPGGPLELALKMEAVPQFDCRAVRPQKVTVRAGMACWDVAEGCVACAELC